MLGVASPVIQVVTTGTDWPAIVAVISTGIVGLAGISATLWQARRTWSHEDERAKVAEKRRIYAEALTAFSTFFETAGEGATLTDTMGMEVADREFNDALVAAKNSMYALALIAPDDIAPSALEAIFAIRNYSDESRHSSAEAFGALIKELRKDLKNPRSWENDSLPD